MTIIHCNLKDLIESRNLSQKELANLSKTREATISAMCKNELKRYPKDVLERIADALNLEDMNQLFTIKK
ncbi:helix-turn-helix domain-containing protein [Cytobacillus firmus]|uniref:helix-turn-helix domain-containing protein n=1 Tax=Cytobacillus firmus TaxID=1399 RepID=UPI001CFEFF39|nr:helix-turn-helix transcriptional regulator [Cytobacillus firmus]